MRKIINYWIVVLILLVASLVPFVSEAANKMWWATGLTGGSGALDGIDGDSLTDGDGAFVFRDNSSTYEAYFYRLEDYVAAPPAESSPTTITPNTNPGNKRWKLLKLYATEVSATTLTGAVTGNASTSTALAANGANCSAGYSPLGVDASGAVEGCWLVSPEAIGAVSGTGGNAATATSLAANGANCSAGYAPLGVDASGAVEGCWEVTAGSHDHDELYMALSTVTAAGDVVVASGSGAITKVAKGANNSVFGVNNSGTLGFYSNLTPILTAAPSTDDTYSGTIAVFVAGEALAQWDVVYCKPKSGVHACYKYDRNGTDKAMPPRAMAVAVIEADASGTFLLNGIVRNDGWSQTTNQDEGKIVYASATPGSIDLTKPSTTADMVAILGYVIEQNIIYFNPSPILVEVP